MQDTSSKRFIVRSRQAARRTLLVLVGCFLVSFAFFFVLDYFQARQLRPELGYRRALSSTVAIAFTAAGVITIILAPFVFLVAVLVSRKKSTMDG